MKAKKAKAKPRKRAKTPKAKKNLATKPKRSNHPRLITFIILSGIILDQFLKCIFVEILQPNESINALPFLKFTLVHNTGSLWGLFNSVEQINMMFIWISIIALGFLMWKKDDLLKLSKHIIWNKVFYALIVAGILGNFIDRLTRGFVVDFLDFIIWPVFNIADSMIVVGVIGLIILSLKKS